MFDTTRRPFGIARQVCRWCGIDQPVAEFWRNPTTGWITQECRSCASERERLWKAVEQQPATVTRMVVEEGVDTPVVCRRCGRARTRPEFYTYGDGTGRRYYRGKCKQCMGAEQNLRLRSTGQSSRRRRTDRDRRLQKVYKITLADYDTLLEAQESRCAICRTQQPGGPTPTSAFHVDHCHTTMRVRGLLCRACNTAIGLLREDPQLFAAALAYLGRA